MYLTMSPENLPSSSLRKSSTTATTTNTNNSNNFKSSSKLEDHQIPPENTGRIITGTGNTTSSLTSRQHPQEQQHQSSSSQSHTPNSSTPQTHHESSSPSRDVLLQWGQRKRSRCSRMEGRSMEKHHPGNHGVLAMPPPHPSSLACTSSNGARTAGAVGGSRVRTNALLYSKDSHGFLPSKNRNHPDQMGCTNGTSPPRSGVGGSGRGVARSSIGKRSPSCVEKNEKRGSGSGVSIRKIKSDNSLGNGGHHLHHQVEYPAEQENNNGGGHHHGSAATMARSPVAEAEKANGEVVEWPRIYVSLSRKEKEDDFYAMKGSKLPHRPKKRAKAVDRALQYCFPGLWLSDLTRARYEVRERKSTKKPKRRGLKGLENMESESE